jgi:signal transduction histidine kinase/CheY-like chemotaxis protein
MLNVQTWLRFGSFILLPWTLLIIGMAVARVMQGFVSARYFLLAYSAVAAVAVLFWLRSLGIIESSSFLEYSLQGATALEALLLSFALAHRMTALKQENERIQKQATEELEQRVHERTRELHQALNARSEFLATISHEVRTPLNGILGNVDLIRDKGLDEDQSRYLRVIEQSGYTLLHLINDVLDYAKIEAGRMELEHHSFDLRALVNDCMELFEQKAKENRVALSLEITDGDEKPVRGDSLRLRQILSNLISNAIKFTLDGEVRIRVRHEPDNADYVLFEVSDTGTGIDRERAARLFEHFYQVDASTSRRHGGSGLGLAIARQLVELMGGEINVDSEPGKGSRFWFRVPLPPAERVEAEAEETCEPDAAWTPARVLVVDDNHTNLMVAQGQCQKLGHEVLTAESGTEAIAVLLGTARMPQVILMDCEMPDMDGFETTTEIRRLQGEGRIPDIPVVALTAHAVPDKIRACHDAGMITHIAKPVSRQKLGREIERALHNASGPPDNALQSRAG